MQVSEFLAKIEQGQRDFRNVSLPKVKLHSAQIPLLNLDGANLEGADFTNANLAGSTLGHADLSNSKMSGSNLLGAQCLKTSFRGADLSNALLSGAEFQGCDFKQANLSHASCVGVDLSGANLRYANLSHINLKSAKLKGTDLYGANLTGADLEGADLEDLIWPDGTGHLMIDEGTTEEQEDAVETANPPLGSFGQSSQGTTPETTFQAAVESPSSAPNNAESPIRFGDFALDDHTSSSLRSSSTGILSSFSSSSFSSSSETAQQRSLRLASQIASRLDRQVEYRFKKAVKNAYGDRCALSKSSIVSLLETVVIFPDAENDRDHPSNGLLLRIDLARLFQGNLIAIDPTDYRVILSPRLQGSEYANFAGVKLNLPKEVGYHPNRDFLNVHFNQCSWINDLSENVQPASEESIGAVSSDLLAQPNSVKSSRFVDLSKTWLKRINEVLNTPIIAKPASEKSDSKDNSRGSVDFVPIAADAEPETSVVADAYSEIPEGSETLESPTESPILGSETLASEGEVIGDTVIDASGDTSVDAEEQVEVISFSTLEIEEEKTEEQFLIHETLEEGTIEETIEEEIKSPVTSSPSVRTQDSEFSTTFAPSSVTLNLDRLQSELDAISKDLEPYLESTAPVENVSDLIETIEKELEDDLGSIPLLQ